MVVAYWVETLGYPWYVNATSSDMGRQNILKNIPHIRCELATKNSDYELFAIFLHFAFFLSKTLVTTPICLYYCFYLDVANLILVI
jgi:hypothetical protein